MFQDEHFLCPFGMSPYLNYEIYHSSFSNLLSQEILTFVVPLIYALILYVVKQHGPQVSLLDENTVFRVSTFSSQLLQSTKNVNNDDKTVDRKI